MSRGSRRAGEMSATAAASAAPRITPSDGNGKAKAAEVIHFFLSSQYTNTQWRKLSAQEAGSCVTVQQVPYLPEMDFPFGLLDFMGPCKRLASMGVARTRKTYFEGSQLLDLHVLSRGSGILVVFMASLTLSRCVHVVLPLARFCSSLLGQFLQRWRLKPPTTGNTHRFLIT